LILNGVLWADGNRIGTAAIMTSYVLSRFGLLAPKMFVIIHAPEDARSHLLKRVVKFICQSNHKASLQRFGFEQEKLGTYPRRCNWAAKTRDVDQQENT
jgi:hypothetical protein